MDLGLRGKTAVDHGSNTMTILENLREQWPNYRLLLVAGI
jgi:hypothetical protein